MWTRLLAICAVAELLTGLALLAAPSEVVRLLLGTGVEGSAVPLARVAGIALIGLGLACLPGTMGGGARRGMVAYSGLVALFLGYLGATGAASGVLLWPVVGLHAVLAVLLALRSGAAPG